MKKIVTKRIYEKAIDSDGYRLLVDKLWPRGIKKADAKLDDWCKEIAPSTALRKWFDHKEERFQEFSKKYKKELTDREQQVERIKNISEEYNVTLLYGAKDEKHNHALVLKEFLEKN